MSRRTLEARGTDSIVIDRAVPADECRAPRPRGPGGDPDRASLAIPERAICRRNAPESLRERGRASLCALLFLIAAPLLASEKARTFHIRAGRESVRVIVPKTFEPLLPGSAYPNRRKPVEARGLPVAIVDGAAAPALDFLLERRFLVAERGAAPVAAILQALASRPEADTKRVAVLAFRDAPAEPPAVRATVVFDPAETPSSGVVSGTVAAFLRQPGREPGDALSSSLATRFGTGVVEKWYRGEKAFPEQAYRDAAEWAASLVSR
ncbi:MAG: hypothetical protein ACRD16_15830 [Thermoanaerobaculia bacterium]